MQFNKLIDDLKEFKNPDYLVEEFYKVYCHLNHREYDGTFENLTEFPYTTPLKAFDDNITHTETITFKGFKLQRFNSKTKLAVNEFEKLTQLERDNFCQHFIFKLKEVMNFFKDPEFKQYFEELKLAIEALSIKYSTQINKTTKNNSFKYKDGTTYLIINNIFDWLKKELLIEENTDLLNFKLVFQNKPIEKLIEWIGTASELKYFIKIINTSDYGFEDNGDEKWRVAVKCFSKTKKRSFEKIDSENLRTYKVTKTTKLKIGSLLANVLVLKRI
jgi:hypothetical protein